MSSLAPDSTPPLAGTSLPTDSSPLSTHPPTLDPQKHNQVHQATQLEDKAIWPAHNVLFVFALIAAIFALVAIVAWIIMRIPGLPRIPSLIVVAIISAGIGLWQLTKVIAKARKAAKTPPIPSDTSYRLRIIGPPALTESAIAPFNDDPFEPIILRSYFAVSFVDEKHQLPALKKYDKPPKVRYLKTKVDHGQHAAYIHTFCALVALAIVALFHYSLFKNLKLISAPHIWAIMGLHALIFSLIRPTYIRIAPGALDVLYFPALWFKSHRTDRYNLTTSSIAIDLKSNVIMIHDPSRPDRKTLSITLTALLPRTNLPRDLLAAARSTHPTPPLPTDALTG